MRQIAAIRTHRWGEDEERLAAALRPAFGENLVVVYHNRPEERELPLPAVDLRLDWVRSNGLRVVPDWAWRCGDYGYYALRQARPDFDHYWLIEPDVFFHGPAEKFFAAFDAVTADGLGLRPQSDVRDNHPFCRSLKPLELYRAIFALTRFSGRALDRLYALRRQTRNDEKRRWAYPNDELFAFTHLANEPELSLEGFEQHAPGWIDPESVVTDPDFLLDAILQRDDAEGKIYHPVRSRASFKAAVTARIADRGGFLDRMQESLAHLEDAELQDIAAAAQERFLARLRANARRDGAAQ